MKGMLRACITGGHHKGKPCLLYARPKSACNASSSLCRQGGVRSPLATPGLSTSLSSLAASRSGQMAAVGGLVFLVYGARSTSEQHAASSLKAAQMHLPEATWAICFHPHRPCLGRIPSCEQPQDSPQLPEHNRTCHSRNF